MGDNFWDVGRSVSSQESKDSFWNLGRSEVPKEKVIEEQHPELTFWDRLKANTWTGGNPEFVKRFLENKGFEVRPKDDWRFEIRKKGEPNWHLMDPSSGNLWERIKDVTDVSREAITTQLAGMASGPGLKLAVKNPLLGIPYALIAGAGTGTLAEDTLLRMGKTYGNIPMTPSEEWGTAVKGGLSAETGYLGGKILDKPISVVTNALIEPGKAVQSIGRVLQWPWEKISNQTERKAIEQASKDLAAKYADLNAQKMESGLNASDIARQQAELTLKANELGAARGSLGANVAELQAKTQPPIATEFKANALVEELKAKYAGEIEAMSQGRQSLRADIAKVQAETAPAYAAKKGAQADVRLAEYKAWKEAEDIAKKLATESPSKMESKVGVPPESPNIPTGGAIGGTAGAKWDWPESLLYPDTGWTAKALHENPGVVEVLKDVFGEYFTAGHGSWSMAHRTKFLADALRTWSADKISAISRLYTIKSAKLIKLSEAYKSLNPEVKTTIDAVINGEIKPGSAKTVDEIFKSMMGKPPKYLTEAEAALRETIPSVAQADKIRAGKAAEFATRRAEIAAKKPPEELTEAKRALVQARGPASRARAERQEGAVEFKKGRANIAKEEIDIRGRRIDLSKYRVDQKALEEFLKEKEIPLSWNASELAQRRAALPSTEDYGFILKGLRDIPRTAHLVGRGVEGIGKWFSRHPVELKGLVSKAPTAVQTALSGAFNMYKKYGDDAFRIALSSAILNPAVRRWLESLDLGSETSVAQPPPSKLKKAVQTYR